MATTPFNNLASSSSSPCAACKFLRRKCTAECVFAPYFPADNPQKFAHVHKVFGASNVSKMLNEIPVAQREDAASSLAYEAEARMKDPVYGCVGTISLLQRHVASLQQELTIARSHLSLLQSTSHVITQHPLMLQSPSSTSSLHHHHHGHNHPQHVMHHHPMDISPLLLTSSSASSHDHDHDHMPSSSHLSFSSHVRHHESSPNSSSHSPHSTHTSTTNTSSGMNSVISRVNSSSQTSSGGIFNNMGYFKLEP